MRLFYYEGVTRRPFCFVVIWTNSHVGSNVVDQFNVGLKRNRKGRKGSSPGLTLFF